jgi:peptidoglycan/LPS O-acetylase OafA/YrhL
MFYVHNIVYGRAFLPKLIPVAWSLEIEVQFYILAPLLTYIFKIKSASVRRVSIVILVLFFNTLRYFIHLPFVNLLDFIQYFLIGFLLVDLYISNSFILPKTRADNLICLVCFMVMWLCSIIDVKLTYQQRLLELIQLIVTFFFYYYVLFHRAFRLLSAPVITNIGGMCYSIYLLHLSIILMFGKYPFSKGYSSNIFIFAILTLILIFVISAVFFLLIERPCMDKNWYKKLFRSRPLPQAQYH